jgi:hypothetical protein
VIALYMKNSLRRKDPPFDFVRVLSQKPPRYRGYRIDRDAGPGLVAEDIDDTYLAAHGGWYHPATCWEITRYRDLGGKI